MTRRNGKDIIARKFILPKRLMLEIGRPRKRGEDGSENYLFLGEEIYIKKANEGINIYIRCRGMVTDSRRYADKVREKLTESRVQDCYIERPAYQMKNYH